MNLLCTTTTTKEDLDLYLHYVAVAAVAAAATAEASLVGGLMGGDAQNTGHTKVHVKRHSRSFLVSISLGS